MNIKTRRTVFLIIGGILYPVARFMIMRIESATTLSILMLVGAIIASLIATILWFGGFLLWARLKNRHWAFIFLGLFWWLGALIMLAVPAKTPKAPPQSS